MADQKNTELNQAEVFKYIDQELRSGKSKQSTGLLQKTRSSFKLVLFVNVLAISITVSGFLIVNKIFRDQAYELVGSEKSIKGLEDVLLAELQKKASADLLNKQKELDDIKKRLTDLNGQMDSFKANQEIQLKKKLSEQENLLKNKLLSDMKNKSVQEQEEIRKKYDQELKELNRRLQQDSLKQEEEYKKKIEGQKESLIASQQQNEKALQQAKTELTSAQDEYKKKLEEERQKGQAALQQVSLKLEERQKIDDFYFQVNSLFQNAINNYNNGKYSEAREILNGVKRLYDNKPDDIPISTIKKDVDMFFISAINDYLSIKDQKGTGSDLQEYLVSLKNMEDFSDELKKGMYNSRVEQANKKIDELKNQLPQVFKFYSSYSGFQVLLDDVNAQSELNIADSDFAKKDYASAAKHYLSILKSYPEISSRETVLNRLSTSLLAGSKDISQDIAIQLDQKEIDKSAKRMFDQALKQFNTKNYKDARSGFQNQILKYPSAKYTEESIQYISQINEELVRLSTVDLNQIKEKQNKAAQNLYTKAEKSLSENNYETASLIYEEIIIKYPLSLYHDKSLQKYKSIQNTLGSQVNIKGLVNEEEVQNLFNIADNLAQQNKLIDSLKVYQDLVLKYPGSTNTGIVLRKMDMIYKKMYSSTNAEVSQIKQDQNVEARKLFDKANTHLKNGENQNAADAFAEILIRYPYSSVLEDSLKGLEQAWKNINTKQEFKNSEQAKDALVLFKKAKDLSLQDKKEEAIMIFSDLILSYPESSHTRDALEYIINNSSGSMISNVGIDLDKIKEDQSKKARLLYLQAQESESEKKYKESSDLYADIIVKYPLSFYVTDSLKGLQRSISSMMEEKIKDNSLESNTQTAIFLTRNVGRVIDKIDEEIIIDVFPGNVLEDKDELYIMRKQNEKILFYVGEASISRMSPVMSKATITKEVGDINIGDLIFMK